MSKLETAHWTARDPDELRAELNRTAASSASLGAIAGLLLYHFLATPLCAVEAPRVVSAVLMGVGQHLCKDWQGLRNVERVSEQAYTFTCEKYAAFSKLDVSTGR